MRNNRGEHKMEVKYPRTFHLPWSRSSTDDDKILRNTKHFIGKEVIVTEKLDGENTSMYSDHIHARSTDSKDHPSRHWVKALHGGIRFMIPDGWRICGENVFAMHSIFYDELPSYFLLFSVWNEENICLSWDDTLRFAKDIGMETAPVLYRGVWDEDLIKKLYTKKSLCGGEQEGYVVRLTSSFHYEDFKYSVAKFVRKNHVQTDEHWLNKPIVPNKLI